LPIGYSPISTSVPRGFESGLGIFWLALLKTPAGARYKCQLFASRFADFLRGQGFDAWSTDEGDWDRNEGCFVRGDHIIYDRYAPEHFGYADRTIAGCGYHAVTEVLSNNRHFLIDWTAAQYGYTRPFPLVQPLPTPDAFLDALPVQPLSPDAFLEGLA